MREEVLVLDHNVLDESFGESVYNSWKVISGVDLFTIVGYNLAVYKKIFFCPDVDLEAELKTVKKAKRKISIKYGKNIIYYIDDIELLNKLKGEEIPLLARITAVADTFDAMTSKRSYRDSLPLEKVRAEIEKCSGTQFDPEIAKVFLDIIDNHYDEILEIQTKYSS